MLGSPHPKVLKMSGCLASFVTGTEILRANKLSCVSHNGRNTELLAQKLKHNCVLWRVEGDPLGIRVALLQDKTVHDSKCEFCLLCSMFRVRSSSATATVPRGFDMSLLWVFRGHVALASDVLEGILTKCGPIYGLV